ncbi:hypothetical protein HDU76_009492, partial [Blyttiomyces sp. JEL0837]
PHQQPSNNVNNNNSTMNSSSTFLGSSASPTSHLITPTPSPQSQSVSPSILKQEQHLQQQQQQQQMFNHQIISAQSTNGTFSPVRVMTPGLGFIQEQMNQMHISQF